MHIKRIISYTTEDNSASRRHLQALQRTKAYKHQHNNTGIEMIKCSNVKHKVAGATFDVRRRYRPGSTFVYKLTLIGVSVS
jgi:hypothetical protein